MIPCVRRRGFTLIELLVVIGIIALLTGLLLPAVQSSRSTGRRAVCANNIRNIGLALISETESANRYPAAGYFSQTGLQYHSWVVALLPRLERTDIADLYDKDQAWSVEPNMSLGRTSIEVLVCPDDITAVQGEGNLSYGVNGGFGWTVPDDCPAVWHVAGMPGPTEQPIDFNGNGVVCPKVPAADGTGMTDRAAFQMTGLFFVENWPRGIGTVRFHRPAGVIDGHTRTLMVAETIRVGHDPHLSSGWTSPELRHNGFLLTGYVCKDAKCTPENVDMRRANDRSAEPQKWEAINAGLDQAEGDAPWPSSYHPGGVMVVYCDGRTQMLNADIDGAVYAALVTPSGTRLTGPLKDAADPTVTP